MTRQQSDPGRRDPEDELLDIDEMLRLRALRRWPNERHTLAEFFGRGMVPDGWRPNDVQIPATRAFVIWATTFRRPRAGSPTVIEQALRLRALEPWDRLYLEERSRAAPSLFVVREYGDDDWLTLEDIVNEEFIQVRDSSFATLPTLAPVGTGLGGFLASWRDQGVVHRMTPFLVPDTIDRAAALLRDAGFTGEPSQRMRSADLLGALWSPDLGTAALAASRRRASARAHAVNPPGRTRMLELEVSLTEIRPRIWRRFLIAADARFAQLHDAIQRAFGWEDYHLWSFRRPGRRGAEIAAPLDPEGWEDAPDANEVPLRVALGKKGDRCAYTYDFGDDWLHDVRVRDIVTVEGSVRRRLLDGRRACPPEDCGGLYGYERCAEFVLTGGHSATPDESGLGEWLPAGWHPDAFDLQATRSRFDA